jgi:hypothetical protein
MVVVMLVASMMAPLLGQQAAESRFEVVSVKPNRSIEPGGRNS